MKVVKYVGSLASAWVPSVGRAFDRDEPTEVTDEEAEVLLSLEGYEEATMPPVEKPKAHKPKDPKTEEGGN